MDSGKLNSTADKQQDEINCFYSPNLLLGHLKKSHSLFKSLPLTDIFIFCRYSEKQSSYLFSPFTSFIPCLTGAHLNPAVTLSFCALRKVRWGRLLPYWLSQMLGAYVASALVYVVYYGWSFRHHCHHKSSLSANKPIL